MEEQYEDMLHQGDNAVKKHRQKNKRQHRSKQNVRFSDILQNYFGFLVAY